MKVLVYYDKNNLKPVGGPSGYLYNLYNELLKEKVDYIEFLDSKSSNINNKIKNILKKLPTKLQKRLKTIKSVFIKDEMLNSVLSNSPKIAKVNLNDYDIVHFHTTLSMYLVKDSLEEYKGKVIITSHSPKVLHKEIIEDLTPKKDYLNRKNEYDKLEIIDEYAFNRADYIVFPTIEAEECYYNTWDKYSEIKEKNKSKYLYLPTGIIPIQVTEKKEEIRKKYGIPQDAFVVSYIGRHNEVKGYDKLKRIGQKLLAKNPNVYFLIAGKEEPLKGLEDRRWIEVGWNNKPHELVNASDLFMLPNKETYFDLVLLEVMSVGKAILLTNTGGNKYFKKFENSGLIYYEHSEIDNTVNKVQELIKEDMQILGNKNKEIFENNFTVEIFTKNYLEILQKIGNSN